MKYYFIFIHFLLFGSYTFAQSSIGLQVGVDYSKIIFFGKNQGAFDNILEEDFAFPSSLFGISGTHKLSKRLSGEISISHTLKKDIPKTDFFNDDPNSLKFALGYNALNTSIAAKYKLFKDTHVGLGLFSRYLYNVHSIRIDGVELLASKNVSNLGLLINLDYEYDSFTFQLNYSIGRKLRFDFNSEFFDLVERIQSIDLRIIYKFTL